MNNNKYFAKKRMMFIQREDYNFLAYNLLLVLYVLDCTDEKKRFKDFRKIAYIIDFISNGADTRTYSNLELAQTYVNAQLIKMKLLSHLLIVLKNRKFIDVSMNDTHKTFDIWLNISNIPNNFFDIEYFGAEIKNINEIKSKIRSFRGSTIKSVVDEFYTNKGVLTWVI
jgi:hypothetical protein